MTEDQIRLLSDIFSNKPTTPAPSIAEVPVVGRTILEQKMQDTLRERENARQLALEKEFAARPISEKLSGAAESAKFIGSTVARSVGQPFAELYGRATDQPGLGKTLAEGANLPESDLGLEYTIRFGDAMEPVAKAMEASKIPDITPGMLTAPVRAIDEAAAQAARAGQQVARQATQRLSRMPVQADLIPLFANRVPDLPAPKAAVRATEKTKKGKKMLQGVYRGYTGDRLDEPVLSITPQRRVAEYYANRRSVERGEDPHVEMLMVDPSVGKDYGLSIPIDRFNRDIVTTRAKALAPEDVVERTQLKKSGGQVSSEIDLLVPLFQKGGSAIKGAIAAGKAAKQAQKAKPPKVKQTVKDPVRVAFPGIYQRPDVIAAQAAAQVAPESPALKQLFGVTRQDLADIAKSRQGNLPGTLPGAAANPRGSEAASQIMTRANEQRILDAMSEAEKYPELVTGMDPWYVMDPLYQLMVKELGPEMADQEYRKMNILMGMASPGSEVTTEIPRGTAAYYLQNQGRFSEFEELLGMPASQRGPDFPQDIRSVPGHMYHSTAQAVPMRKYLESGKMEMTTPKVPLYIEASGVPEIGFQTQTPVGDAHFVRATGLADVRGAKQFAGSVTNPEMTQLAPWWRKKIAGELGIEPVSAQARAWGTFAPQTGVTTPIGSPKLELLADQAVLAGQRMGISAEEALKMFIIGEGRLGKKKGGAVRKGGLAAQS